ncbi:adhesion G protein-coupled receptor G3-like isoform X2 [Seriola aureovittata]|uniref:adhesion G protein-coupled receptor G3-like isoform X2 n=1 Tax=Seriola aureovittata TaxID=2871759 RepID=UPI0024BE4E2D|nr:adhesion G protein-coupled receptor G3-like isoform X2 [Seriola aureovittata]
MDMTQKSFVTWFLLAGLLWILPVCVSQNNPCTKHCGPERHNLLPKCLKCFCNDKKNLVVVDNFNAFINKQKPWNQSDICTLFLQKNDTFNRELNEKWPQIVTKDGSYLMYISRWYIRREVLKYVLHGKKCNATDIKDSTYSTVNRGQLLTDRYIINITATDKNCVNCNNPVKAPEVEIVLNKTIPIKDGGLDPVEAVKVMDEMAKFASSINGSTAALSAGEGVTGILVKNTESELEEVSFAYKSVNDSLRIIEDRDSLSHFSRSVTVSKEAFEKAQGSNTTVPFAAVFRFLNLGQDESKSTVLGNEVLAVEMGATILNLTEKININFWNMSYEGTPHCHSWNGEGSRPNWTDDGCLTVKNGSDITCQCSHLTFFAILLAPPNETISSSDLSTLTTISQIGCGISMFFLSIVLFTHFLIRKTKATKATRILIHLVLAMFFLNFTFLINNFVAKVRNTVGCRIMAALMHYFMLATFTWFAAQAFHICLQLYGGGKIDIHHYILKVSITSWVIPSIVGIVLLIIGKYGEQVIYTDNIEDSVAMCWITDIYIHYFVNIGYYALVFLFTFTTFIIILSWLFCLKRSKTGTVETKRNGISIVTIVGLCCMLGITWGFAFFAYGVLRIPSYYIFTVLNSFQGFFLFIYYYTTGHSKDTKTGASVSTTSSNSTLKTDLDIFDNPYSNVQGKK